MQDEVFENFVLTVEDKASDTKSPNVSSKFERLKIGKSPKQNHVLSTERIF